MTVLGFFVPCVPPTANHQRKAIVRVGGFARLADKPELVAAKGMLDSLLYPHRPAVALAGPVSLTVDWTWPWRASETKKRRALGRVPHTSKPDLSNALKTLEDRLVALRFVEDDRSIVQVTMAKWWGDQPGILVSLAGRPASGREAARVDAAAGRGSDGN